MSSDRIRVMLVDDHSLVRRGVASLLASNPAYQVVAEASDGLDALAQLEQIKTDVVVLDLHMPRLNGTDTIRKIVRAYPEIRIVVLSMYDDAKLIEQAINDGAMGYVLKQDIDEELVRALDKAILGQVHTTMPLDAFTMSEFKKPEVSERERQVLQLIADGHTTNEIAELLFISPHTANRHRANLMQKLNVHTRMGLIRSAVERGLIVFSKKPVGEQIT